MVQQIMKKTMDNPKCQWVKARLPLWVGEFDDDCRPGGEAGELSATERRKIDHHLNICSTCQRYRAELEQTMGILAATAAELTTDPEAPSIWPILVHLLSRF